MRTYDGLAARRAGLFYLAAAFFYIFGMMYVDGRVRVAGDAAATLRNIAELGTLYRLGFMSTLLGHVCLLVVAASLYGLYAPVDAGWARLLVVFVVAGVSISFANRAHQLTVERLALGAYALGAGTEELARAFLDLFNDGDRLSGIFWGLWLLPAGVLALKSGFAPKVLGVVLIAACVLYVATFMEYYLLNPPPAFLAAPLAAVHAADSAAKVAAELGFIGWLLFAGFRRRGR